MPQCYVLNCGNYYSKTRLLSGTSASVMYHVFPTTPAAAARWAKLCRGANNPSTPPQHARVCSEHFSAKNYIRDLEHELLGLPKRRKLVPDAAPDQNLPPVVEEVKQNGDDRVKQAKRRKSSGDSDGKEVSDDGKQGKRRKPPELVKVKEVQGKGIGKGNKKGNIVDNVPVNNKNVIQAIISKNDEVVKKTEEICIISVPKKINGNEQINEKLFPKLQQHINGKLTNGSKKNNIVATKTQKGTIKTKNVTNGDVKNNKQVKSERKNVSNGITEQKILKIIQQCAKEDPKIDENSQAILNCLTEVGKGEENNVCSEVTIKKKRNKPAKKKNNITITNENIQTINDIEKEDELKSNKNEINVDKDDKKNEVKINIISPSINKMGDIDNKKKQEIDNVNITKEKLPSNIPPLVKVKTSSEIPITSNNFKHVLSNGVDNKKIINENSETVPKKTSPNISRIKSLLQDQNVSLNLIQEESKLTYAEKFDLADKYPVSNEVKKRRNILKNLLENLHGSDIHISNENGDENVTSTSIDTNMISIDLTEDSDNDERMNQERDSVIQIAFQNHNKNIVKESQNEFVDITDLQCYKNYQNKKAQNRKRSNSNIENIPDLNCIKQSTNKTKHEVNSDETKSGNVSKNKKLIKVKAQTKQLPVRSSIRIAKRKSIEVAKNFDFANLNPSKCNGVFEKLKFMELLNLKCNERTMQNIENKSDENGEDKIEDSMDSNSSSLNRMLVMEESEELQDKKASSTNFKEDSENPTSTSDDIVTSENCEDLKKDNTKEIVNNEVKCEDIEVSTEEKKEASQNDVTFDNSIQDEPQNLSNNTNISSEPMKRNLEDNLDGPNKKSKPNHFENDTDIKIINDIFESAGNLSLQEVQDNEHKLLSDIEYLNEQMKEKEREWNQILHLKKMKEELLIRLQRKRDVMLISNSRDIDWEMALDMHMKKNTLNNNNNGISGINLAAFNLSNSGVTVMPVSSTSPSKSPKMNSILIDGMNLKQPKSDRNLLGSMINRQRSILPKPLNASNSFMLPSVTEYNGLQKTGPKGQPIMDVNSIVEKFRLNHPEEVPRRTRRGKIKNIRRSDVEIVTSSKRPPGALINSTVQSIPNRVDPHSELGIMLASSTSDNINIRPRSFPSNDTLPHTRMHTNPAQISNPSSVSFKDVLVQFARLSQSERREIQAQASVNNFLLQQGANAMNVKPPPPPYPEVTLHPVINNGATTVTSNSQQSNSLLHGILTKNQSKADSKSFTTLSPTLARLLTGANSHPSDVSDINDLLSNAQNQSLQLHGKTESPLNFGSTSGQIPTTSSASQPNSHSVVNLDDAEAEDSADRLVIDESNETATNNVKNVDENTEENEGSSSGPVPTCQGCKENPAQFVCAGCTSQWYCSRDCQVSDWDDHCEVCSG